VRLLVVGEPRSGKTSWCSNYIERRRKSGSSVGGILSLATDRQGRRIGFNVIDLLTGQEVPFARLSSHRCFKEGKRVGDYTISKDGILFGRGAIERAVDSSCDLVVVDEVGPLELSGEGLMPAVEMALASSADLLIVVRSSLKGALERRFPDHQFVVVADPTQLRSSGPKPADHRSCEAASYEWHKQSCQPENVE
jgi:nucleoside-triphosphatase